MGNFKNTKQGNMDFSALIKLESENLTLRAITIDNKPFLDEMYSDPEIRKYNIFDDGDSYYLHTEILIKQWVDNMSSKRGFSWIIFQKNGTKCGFITFHFHDSYDLAKITYAILPKFRNLGIATEALNRMIIELKNIGIKFLEAHIVNDNTASEKVVEKLGFKSTDKASIDPVLLKKGIIRMTMHWKKDLVSDEVKELIYLPYRITDQKNLIEEINRIISLINTKGKTPILLSKYYYLFGRIKVNEGNYQEAYQAFGQCNITNLDNDLDENHETYFWFAKIMDLHNDSKEDILKYLNMSKMFFKDNPELIPKHEIEVLIKKYTHN